LVGFNDLKTKYPEIANEADGWDPTTVLAGSHLQMLWKCQQGHTWISPISKRTSSRKGGCPYCANKKLLVGFNDLQTKFPQIAKEAHGWDPTTVVGGSTKRMLWKCQKGHIWVAKVVYRTGDDKTACPYCSGQKLLVGFNDLQTKYPEIAKEADGWDPTTVVAGTHVQRSWKCQKGHVWTARISNRASTNKQGCPTCADYGFSIHKDAWLYLMERPGEQQFGITNVPQIRRSRHKCNGWQSLDWHGPAIGKVVLKIENELKQWIKRTHGTVLGTKENWFKSVLEVKTLTQLCALAGVDLTPLLRDMSLIRNTQLKKTPRKALSCVTQDFM
jgi:hypothetical protein